MNIKFSIIIPVYNCFSMLEGAIESVVKQPEFEQIELILVDDGSTDGSSAICDEYAERFTNIKVIHQENSGVSVARNSGIKCANGEWICFIDSDDYLLDDALTKFFKYGEADLICAEHKSNDSDSVGIDAYLKAGNCYITEISESLEDALASSNNYFYTCWAKLFKRDIIIENNIFFPPGRKFAEDMVFVFTYLRFCKTLSIVDEAVYYYFINKLNATSVVPKSFETFLFIFEWKKECFNDSGYSNKLLEKWLISSFLFKSFFAIKTAGTYLKGRDAISYIRRILENDTFYSLYISSDEYVTFKNKIDVLLDKFIRKKKPLYIFIMFKFLNLKTKILRK